MPSTRLFFAIIFGLALCKYVHCQSAFIRCRLLYRREICFFYYSLIKESILSNPKNIFEMQQAFYPKGKFTSEHLINVMFTIHFTEDFFDASPCPGNHPNITNGSLEVLTAWTSSEIFNIISPLQLSELQLQISNIMYGQFVIPGGGIPLTEGFGWQRHLKDAENNQVNLIEVNLMYLNVSLNLNGSNVSLNGMQYVPCLPDERLMLSVLQDITVMLKIWASGNLEEIIDEKDLGFATEPGFRVDGVPQIIFTPFFAAMVAAISSVVGLCSIIGLGATLPKMYGYFAMDRRQFKFYFFALAACLMLLNIIIICVDLKNIPERCNSIHFSYISNSKEVGCSGIVIMKLIYIFLAIFLSFIVALLSSKYSEVLKIRHKVSEKCEKVIYICCCWSIILFVSIVIWAIAPTILMLIVYPNIVLSLTVIMVACIFWFTVTLTIPQIFFHNIRMNTQCLDALRYLLPFAVLVVILFVFGLITVTYVNCVVFGSNIGGPIGLILATIPSILLTFFSEFYRDWFLTRTVETQKETGQQQDCLNNMEMATVSPGQTGMDNVMANNTTNASKSKKTSLSSIFEEGAQQQQIKQATLPPTLNKDSQRGINRKRNTSRLVSTGEPPGLLQRRLQDFAIRPRVHSTPLNNKQ